MMVKLMALIAASAGATALTLAPADADVSAPPGEYVEIDGAQIRYVEEGSGPAILVVHGASSNGEDMRLALSGHLDGYRAIYVDRPGLGWSERPPGEWNPEAEAELLAELITELDMVSPIVIGHSWGGAVSTRLAMDHPGSVSGLVLIAPALMSGVGEAAWYNRATRIFGIGPIFTRVIIPLVGPTRIESGLETTFSPQPVPDGYAEAVRVERLFEPSVIKANAADMAPVNRWLADQDHRYENITQPVVILAGPDDQVVFTHRHSIPVSARMPEATLITDEAWGHMLHHWAPEAVANAVADVQRRSAR